MNEFAHPASAPQVRTLLLTDLCDSTLLVERLGDGPAAELFRAHDRLVLDLQQRWRGRLIDRSDGLLLLFERPVDGLGFALDYARGLRELGERPEVKQRKLELRARAGLHVGEVLTWHNSEAAVQAGAKPLEVEGIAKPLAGRLMALARPGQILLSATAEPLARRASRELGERADTLIWKSHGRWRFKGMPDGQEIFEVGEPGHAPLRAPKQNGGKAWRDIPLWRRPAALAAEILLVVGMGTGLWFITRPTPAIAFNERDWVVVGDLRNLTGDAVLDESLEQAFRISLEQSRYVNVLSDLKVRETLQLMKRPPDARVDRELGSEIAIRDGARALILPTVAEVGGRLRVSAEVVDPHTQATVYAESVDGRGVESAIGSIDKVTAELREQLGEALSSIEKTSISLPNVSTANLDALKAYAIAYERIASGEFREGAGFFERAVKLDPHFGLAYLRLARAYGTLGDLPASQRYFEQAMKLRDRLPPREAIFLDAEAAERGGDANRALEQWKQVTTLYPDDHYAHHRLAQYLMFYANRYADALPHAKAAATLQSPYRGLSWYLQGMVLTAEDRYEGALAAFRQARQVGFSGAGFSYAYAHAARRNFAGAAEVLSARHESGAATAELELVFAKLLLALDQGQWPAAIAIADQGVGEARRTGSNVALAEWRSRALLTRVLAGSGSHAEREAALLAELKTLKADTAALDASYPLISQYLLLALGYSGVRNESPAIVEAVLHAQPANRIEGLPLLVELRQMLVAEQYAAKGQIGKAMDMVAPLAESDSASFPVHATLLRLSREAKRDAVALREAQWLTMHRGRAYIEHADDYLSTPANVVDTTAALLDAAEILSQRGDAKASSRALATFLSAWQRSSLQPRLAERVDALQPPR